MGYRVLRRFLGTHLSFCSGKVDFRLGVMFADDCSTMRSSASFAAATETDAGAVSASQWSFASWQGGVP